MPVAGALDHRSFTDPSKFPLTSMKGTASVGKSPVAGARVSGSRLKHIFWVDNPVNRYGKPMRGGVGYERNLSKTATKRRSMARGRRRGAEGPAKPA